MTKKSQHLLDDRLICHSSSHLITYEPNELVIHEESIHDRIQTIETLDRLQILQLQ